MQETTPATNHRRPDPEAHASVWVDATWFDNTGEQPIDTPLIVLIPVPRDPDQDRP